MNLKNLLYVFLIIFCSIGISQAEEYTLVPGVIHLDSNVSGGELSLEEMVEIATKDEMRYAIFTDHDTMRWEYGVHPLRNIIKKVIEKGSVLQYGAKRYVNKIEMLNEKYPEIVTMSGAEAIPFYYWEGSYFKGNMALVNGHEHLIVFGFDNARAYQNLPSIGNGFPKEFTKASFMSLWPFCFIFLGWRMYKYKKTTNVKADKAMLKTVSNPFKIPAYVFFGLGAIFLFNNAPFSTPIYDQYHGRQGIGPFQHLIDYVNDNNGLVFWAHPEVNNDWYDDGGGIKIQTNPYHQDLLAAKNYTGFAVFAEGTKYIAPPMGIWDQILLEYCINMREKPIWAIGEVDFEADTFSIKDTQTILLLKDEISKEKILEALKTGKMYAIHMSGDSAATHFLNNFSVENFDGFESAYMGDEIILDTPPSIKIKVSSDKPDANFRIELIRNGIVIKKYKGKGSIEINFEDDYYEPGDKIYYRLDIIGQSRIISNPIFVEFI